jgi:hypothetical protein
MIKDGKTKYDMAKALLAEFGREAGGLSITGSLDGVIAELKAHQ